MALDKIELRELRTRSRKENSISEKSIESKGRHFIEHYVKQDDSLPKLSLTYGCTISELKQANSIYNEQEFHARKKVKIPVHEHSTLCEYSGRKVDSVAINVEKADQLHRSCSEGSLQYAREQLMHNADAEYLQNGERPNLSYQNDYNDDNDSTDDLDGIAETKSLLSGQVGVKAAKNTANKICEDYLDLVDKDIQQISKRVQSKTDVVDIGAHSLAYVQPNKMISNNNEMLGQAGWFGYRGVICVLCSVSVVSPLIYLLYFLLIRKKA